MPNTLNKIRIQNELIAAGKAGPYFRVTYDCQTDLADEIDEDASPVIEVPASVKANEVRSAFRDAANYRRSAGLDRATWTWLLRMQFHCEVTAERVEENLMENPPCLTLLGPNNRTNQVLLKLVNSDYTHPPTTSPSSGSEITFTFEAVALRR